MSVRRIITIVTVNRNNAAGLERTIQSVLKQTYLDIEYIVIDGNSNDASVEVIKSYESKINYWISEKDRGLYHAMNKGLWKANGSYILHLNSGDYLASPSVIENVVKNLGNADILYGNIALPDGLSLKILKGPAELHYATRYQHNLPAHPSIFPKTALLREIGGFNESYEIIADVAAISNLFCVDQVKWRFLDELITILEPGGLSSDSNNQSLIYQERRKFISAEHATYLEDFEKIYKVSFFNKIKKNLKKIINS